MSVPDLEVLERLPAADVGRPPLLFVHGLGHGAWCWEHWIDAAVKAGHPAYAVSLRGHGGSSGRVRSATLAQYADDVVRTATTLPRPAVLVGHSMGGLVVQRALSRYAARAGVLVAPVPAGPAVAAFLNVARQHPLDALKMLAGITLPMRYEYLFSQLERGPAQPYLDRCGQESALMQYQFLLHRPPAPPLGGAPVLLLASRDDRLLPMSGMRKTAAHYGAQLREFRGLGHDMMLEPRWREPLQAMLDWMRTALPPTPREPGAGP